MKALRINRYLSQAGLGSRRHVEDLVRQGRVRLNGEPLLELSTRIDPERDWVEVDGRPIQLESGRRTLIYHKPRGVVSSLTRQGDAPSLREVLTEDEAVYVAPDDPSALAAGIARLLGDDALRARLAGAMRARSADHTWDARADRILSWMEERQAARVLEGGRA